MNHGQAGTAAQVKTVSTPPRAYPSAVSALGGGSGTLCADPIKPCDVARMASFDHSILNISERVCHLMGRIYDVGNRAFGPQPDTDTQKGRECPDGWVGQIELHLEGLAQYVEECHNQMYRIERIA